MPKAKDPPPDFGTLPENSVPTGRGNGPIGNHDTVDAYKDLLRMILDCGMTDVNDILNFLKKNNLGEFYKWTKGNDGWEWQKLQEKDAKDKITRFISDRKRKKGDKNDQTVPNFMIEMAKAELTSEENSKGKIGLDDETKPFCMYGFDDETHIISRVELNRFVDALNHKEFRDKCQKVSDHGDKPITIAEEDERWKNIGVKSMNNGYMINPDDACKIWKEHQRIYEALLREKQKDPTAEDIEPCKPSKIVEYVSARLQEKRGFQLSDKYFLLIKGEGQVTHIDALNQVKKDGEEVLAGCMYLSKGTMSTVLYDMSEVKKSKEMTWDYIQSSGVWKDAPESVFTHLKKEKDAISNLQSYGRGLFAHPSRRINPVQAEQYSILAFDSDTPHNAPEGERISLFFLAEKNQLFARKTKEKEKKKLQYSRDKLLLSFYNNCSDAPSEARDYMRKMFFDSYSESVIRGVLDATLNWPKEKNDRLFKSAEVQGECAKKLYPLIKNKTQADVLRKKAGDDAEKAVSTLMNLRKDRDTCDEYFTVDEVLKEKRRKLREIEKDVLNSLVDDVADENVQGNEKKQKT